MSIDTKSTPESQRIRTKAQAKQHDPAQSARKAGSTKGITAPPADNQEQPKLAEFLDVAGIQALMDDFYALTGVGIGIIDLQGKVLVLNGWQDICTRFHRVHPEARKNCIVSDTLLSSGIKAGEHKLYKCKNNMWDMATPIIIDGQHVGNIFLGQFFFDDEPVDLELFRNQARQYGFDEAAYLDALEHVPRWPRDKVRSVFNFYTRFAGMLAQLSYGRMMLSRSLDEREGLLKAIRESEALLNTAGRIARVGGWELIADTLEVTWAKETYRIHEVPEDRKPLLNEALNFYPPEDRNTLQLAIQRALKNGEAYDLSLRFITAQGKHLWVRTVCQPEIIDEKVVKLKGILHDITAQQQAEQRLREREAMLNETAKIAKTGGWELDVSTMELTLTTEASPLQGIPENRTQPFEQAIKFCHPDDRETLRSAHQRAIANGESYDLNLRFTTAAGQHIWARMICHPQIVDGNIVKLKGIFQDITELKQAELEQLKQMQELKRWHTATMGREGRVLELKKEVNELLRQAGLPERYPSAEIAADVTESGESASDEG